MKKLITVLLSLILCFTLISPSTAYAATVKLSKTKLTLNVGGTSTLKLSGASGSIKWASSDKKIATVSSKGKVKAISVGKATISATYNKKAYKCSITVKDKVTKVILTALMYDSIEEYAKEYNEDSTYIDVQVYDDSHIIVSMYESERLALLNEFNNNITLMLEEILTSEDYKGVFTDIKTDSLLKDVKAYANKDNYEENSYTALGLAIGLAFLADALQAYNLIDIDDRVFVLTVFDEETGDVLFSTEEENDFFE